MDYKKIADFIKMQREKNGYTQDELAKLIPIGRTAVSKWERGISLPDHTSIIKLSEVLGVSINEILNGQYNNENNDNAVVNLYEKFYKEKRLIKILCLIICLLMFLFLIYYFFTSYKKTNIYTVGTQSDNFKISHGLLVLTNEKYYLYIGKIEGVNKNVTKVEVYLKEKNEDLKFITSDKSDEIYISETKGYNEFFINKFVQKDNEVYLKVYTGEESNLIKLEFIKDYSNKNLIVNKTPQIGYPVDNKNEISEKNKKLIQNLKQKLTLTDEEYLGEFKYKKGLLKFNYDEKTNILIMLYSKSNLSYFWTYDFNNDNLQFLSDEYDFFISGDLFECESNSCDGYEKKIEFFEDILNNQLLNL